MGFPLHQSLEVGLPDPHALGKTSNNLLNTHNSFLSFTLHILPQTNILCQLHLHHVDRYPAIAHPTQLFSCSLFALHFLLYTIPPISFCACSFPSSFCMLYVFSSSLIYSFTSCAPYLLYATPSLSHPLLPHPSTFCSFSRSPSFPCFLCAPFSSPIYINTFHSLFKP